MFPQHLIQSVRVDNPNDFRIQLMGLTGWQLVDATFDPFQRNWVRTFQLRLP